jgi:hypothetical protein
MIALIFYNQKITKIKKIIVQTPNQPCLGKAANTPFFVKNLLLKKWFLMLEKVIFLLLEDGQVAVKRSRKWCGYIYLQEKSLSRRHVHVGTEIDTIQ